MKKYSIFILIFVFLVGCSEPEQQSSKEEKLGDEKREEVAAENKKDEAKEEKKDDMLVTEGKLTEPGQYSVDGRGKATLLKINDEERVENIGPVELTITDVKILRQEASDSFYNDFLYQFTDKKKEDFVQIGVVVKNTSDKKISFDAVDVVVTSNGKQVSKDNDFYLEYTDRINSEYYGEVVKEGGYGILLGGLIGEDIEWIKIHTETVWDNDTHDVLAEPQEIKIEF